MRSLSCFYGARVFKFIPCCHGDSREYCYVLRLVAGLFLSLCDRVSCHETSVRVISCLISSSCFFLQRNLCVLTHVWAALFSYSEVSSCHISKTMATSSSDCQFDFTSSFISWSTAATLDWWIFEYCSISSTSFRYILTSPPLPWHQCV